MRKELLYRVLRENRLLLSATLLLLMLCGAIWYLTLRQGLLLQQQQSSWNSKRRQAAARAETHLTSQYLRDKDQIRHLYMTIPYRHEFPRVISEIMDIIALHDATPGPMLYTPAKTDLDGVIAYDMHCSATGEYPDLKRLISDLERLDGISTLNTCSFSNPDPAFGKAVLDLQLTVYLREGRP